MSQSESRCRQLDPSPAYRTAVPRLTIALSKREMRDLCPGVGDERTNSPAAIRHCCGGARRTRRRFRSHGERHMADSSAAQPLVVRSGSGRPFAESSKIEG
jgi:hypothetical protein